MRLKDFAYLAIAVVLVITGVGSILFFSFSVILQVFTSGISWTSLGFLLLYLFTSVPTFQGIGEWVARGLSFWRVGARSAVAFKVERNLNSIQEKINGEVKGLMPYPAKVEWIGKPSYLDTKEEKIIIRMKEYQENPRNVAFAVIDYVSQGLAPYSRLYIEEPIQTAMDLTIVRTILLERDENALDFFLSNVLNKRLGEEGVQDYMNIMSNLQDRGLLTRVFLEEARELGLKLYPMQEKQARIETEEFIHQLNILATRKQGEIGKADPYVGKWIKIGYVLVADPERLRKEGYMPYLLYASNCLQKDGVEVLYVLSRGSKIEPARKLASFIAKSCNLRIANVGEYEEAKNEDNIKAICIELRSKKSLV